MVRFVRRVPPSTLVFVAVWCALTVVALVPVWHQRMLPMLDTPDHLALARAWHSYDDPSYHIAEHYLLRVKLVPYIGFYALVHALLYVCKIETANKLILSAYLILYPLSILSLARALGRSRWLALGGFVLAFNPGWIYGFTSYLLGTALLYFGLAALIRYLDEGRRRDAVALFVTTTLAYLCHVMAWAILGLGAIALVALELGRVRRAAVACAAMAPSLLLAVVVFVQEQHERAYMNRGDGFVGLWRDVPTSVIEFPKRVMDLFPGSLDLWVLATWAATVVALAAWRPWHVAGASSSRRLRVLLVLFALTYVTLPYWIKKPMEWWYVAPRLPALMAPLLLLLPSVELSRWRALVMTPALISFVVLIVKLTTLYTDFNRRNIGFLRLLDTVPRGASTLVLARGLIAGDPESSGDAASSGPVYWHFMSWPMALHGGFSPYLFDQGIPVRPRPGLPSYNVARTDVLDFASAPEFDYYLVHSSSDLVIPDRRVVEERAWGSWTLFHRVAPQNDEP